MSIAHTLSPRRGDTDLLLFNVARTLMGRGYRLTGTVQINTPRKTGGSCDMDVRILPAGPTIQISQDLGPEARGCRLDPAALETAVGHVEAALTGPVDGLIVNKFGKHEADGRGFRNAIATAMDLDIPVLVGINGLNRDAFLEFAGGMTTEVPPTEGALVDWFVAARCWTPLAGQPLSRHYGAAVALKGPSIL